MKLFIATTLCLFAQGSNPGSLEPLGVCSLVDEPPVCWDRSGVLRPDLLAELRSRLDAVPIPLSFVPGKKNRHVLLRATGSLWTQMEGQDVRNDMTLGGRGNDGWQILRVATSLDAKDWTGSAKVGHPVEPATRVRFRKGETATVAGDRMEIGAIGPVVFDGRFDRFEGWRLGDGRAWQVEIDHAVRAPLSGGLTFVPLDRNGQPIVYVDFDGRPLSRTKAEEEIRRAGGWNAIDPLPARPAVFGLSFPGLGSGTLLLLPTNIDPRSIAQLRVTRIVEGEQTIGPLPLDPQPSGPK